MIQFVMFIYFLIVGYQLEERDAKLTQDVHPFIVKNTVSEDVKATGVMGYMSDFASLTMRGHLILLALCSTTSICLLLLVSINEIITPIVHSNYTIPIMIGYAVLVLLGTCPSKSRHVDTVVTRDWVLILSCSWKTPFIIGLSAKIHTFSGMFFLVVPMVVHIVINAREKYGRTDFLACSSTSIGITGIFFVLACIYEYKYKWDPDSLMLPALKKWLFGFECVAFFFCAGVYYGIEIELIRVGLGAQVCHQ